MNYKPDNIEIEKNFREASKAYLHIALTLYIKLEAKISIYNREKFGDTANIICSLNRAIEHLMKLKLVKTSRSLLYKFPQTFTEYCLINQIQFPKELIDYHKKIKNKDLQLQRDNLEKSIFSITIDFKEAIKRIEREISGINYNFEFFKDIHILRNSLEHHWNRNEEFLKKIIGIMSSKAIPSIKEFILAVLNEDPSYFFNKKLLEEIDILDRAIMNQHSLTLQKRFEEIESLYKKDPESCREKYFYPIKYRKLNEEETNSKCPICEKTFFALFDWEADYDVEGTSEEGYVSGIYPDVKCLHCKNCHFYLEDSDVDIYLPNGLDVNYGEYFSDDYY